MWFRSLFDALLACSCHTRPWKRRPAPSFRLRSRSIHPRLEILEDRTLLSNYVVDSLTDTGAGSGLTGDLRYCITHATSGGDTITFAQSLTGTVTLESALPTLNASVDIQGPGADKLTVIPGYNTQNPYQPTTLSVSSTANVQISGLTLSNGSDAETGVPTIGNAGTLTVSACTIDDTYHRLVENNGTLILSDCTISGNSSSSGDLIDNLDAALTVSHCTLTGNGSPALANSALVYNSGEAATLTVSYSTFSGNSDVCIVNRSSGSATVSYSTFSENRERLVDNNLDGGAIFSSAGMTINNSTIADNWSIGESAYQSVSGPTYPAVRVPGGGIYMGGGMLSINSSTITGNEAIGGSTAGLGNIVGPAGNGLGGGLYIAGGTVSINNSTLADNEAIGGAATLPGMGGAGYGGGIYNAAGPGALQMYDTILAKDTADTADPDLEGSVTSLGHNLIANSTGGSGFAASDLLNVNPQLGPLQNNGGPTQTMALLVGSPALNAGDNTNAPAYDQRGAGYPRIVGGTIDIGAFEAQLASYVVTSTADDGSAGTLRDAINQVNAGKYNEIAFNIPGKGVQTINLTSALPAITASAVFINGPSENQFQGGASSSPLIELNGSGAGSNSDGLLLQGPNCTVSGLIIENSTKNGIEVDSSNTTIGGATTGAGNILSGNSGDGVLIDAGIAGVSVLGNYIGTDVTGTKTLANSIGIEITGKNNTIGGASGSRNLISGNSNDGVKIASGASGNVVEGNAIGVNKYDLGVLANRGNGIEVAGSNNTVGASYAVAPNEISGNSNDGVLLDSGSSGNQVLGNYIGTNHAGKVVISNKVGIEDAGSSNTIGGGVLGARNVISGNTNDGVLIDSTARAETMQGNFIGSNVGANAALANGTNGVEVKGTGNTIGGNSSSNYFIRNFIAGNATDGVLIDSGASGNQLVGNFIGVGISGTNGVANATNGIEVAGSNNIVGGTVFGNKNVISGNGNDGILLDNTATSNLIQGNAVGTDYTGKNPLSNSGNGVKIQGTNNTVGGSAAGAGNIISGNSQDGVLVSAGSGDTISRNSIFANIGSGIARSNGANNNIAAPTVLTATPSGSTLTVTGNFNAPAANISYVLEFFANAGGDAEGKIYLGSLTVTPTRTGMQNFTFTATTTVTGAYPLLTATLTDGSGDTSSFSNGVTTS